jgi:hypothetical protein
MQSDEAIRRHGRNEVVGSGEPGADGLQQREPGDGLVGASRLDAVGRRDEVEDNPRFARTYPAELISPQGSISMSATCCAKRSVSPIA